MNLEAFVKQHGQTGAAKILGVSQGLVWQWLNGETRVTAERALIIEEKSGGAITRYELRPEIFGAAPSNGAPASDAPAPAGADA